MSDRTANEEALQNELEQVAQQRNRFLNERDDIVAGVKRDLLFALDHPEWSLQRIRMHLQAIINERL